MQGQPAAACLGRSELAASFSNISHGLTFTGLHTGTGDASNSNS